MLKINIVPKSPTYSFALIYSEEFDVCFSNPPLNLLQNIHFDCPQAYSGTMVIKTTSKGDFYLTINEKPTTQSILIDLTSFYDKNYSLNLNDFTIHEIIITLGFNTNSQHKLSIHKTNIVVSIQ